MISYYFIKSFGSYKKLFPRVLIEKLKMLPIKVPITTEEKQYADNLNKNMRSILTKMRKKQLLTNNLQGDSDKLIYDLYNISEKDRDYINKFICS